MANAANTGNRILVGLLAGAAVFATAARPGASEPSAAEHSANEPSAMAPQRSLAADPQAATADVLATTIRRPTVDPIDIDRLFSGATAPAAGTIEIPDEIIWLVEDVRCEVDDLRARWHTGSLAGELLTEAIDLVDLLEQAQWTAATLAGDRAFSVVAQLAGVIEVEPATLSLADALLTDAAMSRAAALAGASLADALARLDDARAVAERALALPTTAAVNPSAMDVRRAMSRAAELAWAAVDWSAEASAQLRGRTSASAERWSLRIALLGGWVDGMSERIATGLAGPAEDAQVWMVLTALSLRPQQPETVEPSFASPPTLATTRREPVSAVMPDEPLYPHAPAEAYFDAMPVLDKQH